jgi:GYF domain 2
MPDWYYTSGGQQQGPVNEDQLKSLVAAGSIRPSDLVWNQSMPQWVPADQIGALAPASIAAPAPDYAAVAAPPAQYGALAYEAPSAEAIPFTNQSLQLLRQTRPWVLFIAIVCFIVAGFCVIGGLSVMVISSFALRGGGPGVPPWIGLIYVALAAFYGIPGIYMVRFASRVSHLNRMRRGGDLENALAALKSIFRISGILLITLVVLYVVGTAIFAIFLARR